MKIKKINIGKDIDDIFTIKNTIENKLLEENKIKKKMSLEEFIDYLDLSKSIYIENKKTVVPFSLYKIKEDESIMFHCSTKESDINTVIDALKNIEFDYTQMKELNDEDIMNIDMLHSKLFIINDKYYTI